MAKPTKDELRARLTPEAFHVTQEKGTERPWTGALLDNKAAGSYHCVCCDQRLFDADTKYDSGSGWPSFWQPASPDAVTEKADNSLFMRRVEVVCASCDAHLGHVFEDGPEPTGQRYCMNSLALRFEGK